MNVGAFLTKAARAHPARVAVTDGSSELRYAELDARAAAFADGLRSRGYAAGDRVVIFMPNRPEYLIAMFGLFKGGLVAVPVNAKLHSAELAFILEHSGARAVVFSAKTGEAVEAALASVSGVERIDVDGDWASGDPSGFADAEVDPDDTAWLFYTSGTTGRPKGAMLSHRNLCASAMNALPTSATSSPRTSCCTWRRCRTGSGLYALPSIARAAKNIIYPGGSFDADDVLATARREGVTVIAFLAPTMIHMLLDAGPAHVVPTFGACPTAARRSTPGWRRRRSSGSARCSRSSTEWASRR